MNIRRSVWFPAILAVGILLVVVSGQLGFTREDFHRHASSAVDMVRRIGWPLIWLAAAGFGLRNRDRGLGYFALGLLPLALSQFWRGAPFLLYPLLPVGVALAAIAWARRPGEPAGGLYRVTGLAAGLVAVLHGGYMAVAQLQGPSLEASVAVTGALGLWWGLLAVTAWQGAVRHLRWLSGMALCQTLVALAGVVVMLLPPMNDAWFDPLYLALTGAVPIAAAGVVWRAAVRTTYS